MTMWAPVVALSMLLLPGGALSLDTAIDVTAVVRSAHRRYGGATVSDALRSARFEPGPAVRTAALLEQQFGLTAPADLLLLGGGPEALELMSDLQSRELSLGDRAKLRLLVGDVDHMQRVASAVNSRPLGNETGTEQMVECRLSSNGVRGHVAKLRSMQESSDGLSIDTVRRAWP
eukprot:SAG31_NODE_8517_length_1437_cov_1.351271_1_plen_175_part_00